MSYEIKQEVREILVKKEFIEMSKEDFLDITIDIVNICLENVEEAEHDKARYKVRDYLVKLGMLEVKQNETL